MTVLMRAADGQVALMPIFVQRLLKRSINYVQCETMYFYNNNMKSAVKAGLLQYSTVSVSV